MILTNKQQEGLKIAVARFKAHEPYTCVSGYAGSGKSTLIKFIVNALELKDDQVAYVAYTGKAASVLRHKGCPNAMTAHKLLYYSKRLPNGKFLYRPRPSLDGDYKVIVVDEVSMLPKQLWDLLLSHGIYVLACGDPFQLPPIYKNQDNKILEHPHIFLDEIMRQAKESEIIRLTMDIREGKDPAYFKGNEVHIVKPKEVVDGMLNWADQIITGTNKKRAEINKYMRDAAGRGLSPEVGDKVICLRNCWDIVDSAGENALINGTTGILKEFARKEMFYPIPEGNLYRRGITVLKSSIVTDNGEQFDDVLVDYLAVTTNKKSLTDAQEYQIYRNKEVHGTEPIEFNYGYAITCHRAQGSQWDKVMVFEEKFPYEKIEHARWLYTACTRAAQKLVLVR